jgi:hypothetical protein
MRLVLSNNTQSDEIVAYTDPNATWGYDPDYDAVKIPAGSTVYLSYAQAGKEFAINVIDSVNVQTEFPLILWARDSGDYTFKATVLNLTNLTAYYKDSVTNTLTNLTTDSIVLHLNGRETYTNRYSVVFQATPTTEITPTAEPFTRIFSNGNKVFVQRSSTAPATISIANVLGQQVTEVATQKGLNEIPLAGSEMWYAFVKVTEGSKVTVAKVLISNK